MLAGYRFQPGWLPSLATVVLVAVFAGLGAWQLDRAAQKRDIQQRFEVRSRLPPVDLNDAQPDPETWDFRRSTGRGVYETAYQIFLDNKVYQGVAGYHVLTPLRLTGSQQRILVNRGWVSWGADRRQLPRIPAASGEVVVVGRLRTPQTGYFTLESEAPSTLVSVWQGLDLARYAVLAGIPVLPVVLELAPEARDPANLVRSWPVYRDAWIARHHGYAVQWFALAVALVVIYLAVNIRRPGAGGRRGA